MESPVMLTVPRTYKVTAEMLVQGEDHDVNDVTGPQRRTSSCTHKGNLKVGEEAPELGRGLLAKIISFRGTHVGNTWFGVYLKGI